MRVLHRLLLMLLLFAPSLQGSNKLVANKPVQYSPEVIPQGRLLQVTYSEEWLPEPLQVMIYKIPAKGVPVKGCLSVVSLQLDRAGETLNGPVILTFACENAAGRALPYGYVGGQWKVLPATVDENNRISITVTDLTTYALLESSIS